MSEATVNDVSMLMKKGRLGEAARLAAMGSVDESLIRQILETSLAEYATEEVLGLVESLMRGDLGQLEIETLEAMFEVMRVQKHPGRQEIAARLGVEAAPQLIRPTLGRPAVRRLLQLFQGREDIHARQYDDGGGRGGYSPVRQPLNEDTMRRHLNGQISVGIYLLNSHSMVQFFAIDFDIRRAVLELTPADTSSLLRRLRDEILANQHIFIESGLQPSLEFSGGKGFHLWFFLAEPVPAQLVRDFMQRSVLSRLAFDENSYQVELFPKQDKLNRGGLGNLIKLPLGRHKVSGRWSWFLDWNGQPVKDVENYVLHQIEPMRRYDFLKLAEGLTDSEDEGFRTVREIVDENSDNILTQPAAVQGRTPSVQFKPVSDNPLRQMLAGCDTLRTLLKRIETFRVVEPSERHALIYMLTPLGECGVIEIHRILSMTLDYNMDEIKRLIHAVPPHLISCPKVRKRIPTIAANSSCNCVFDLPEGSYPSPLVHSGILPKASGGTLPKAQLPVLAPAQSERLCQQWLDETAKALECRAKLDNCEYLLTNELKLDIGSEVTVQGNVASFTVRRTQEDRLEISKIQTLHNFVEEA